MLYSRPQLRLLLALAATLLAGLAVGEWRRGFPDAAERLERFDREETPLLQSPPPSAPSAPKPRPAAPPASVPAAAPADAKPVDLNRASAEELARLPGVGPALARRIVEERERRGRFDSPEALRGILGLGPKKLGAIRHLITIGD
jgi:competence ComEA-like helix-hairpin-helix protein